MKVIRVQFTQLLRRHSSHTLKQYCVSSCVFLGIPFSLILLISSSVFGAAKRLGVGLVWAGLGRTAWAGLGTSSGLGAVRSSVSSVSNADKNNSSSLSESQQSSKLGLSRSLSRRRGSISLLASCSSVDTFLDTAFLGTYPITLSKLDASTNGIYAI